MATATSRKAATTAPTAAATAGSCLWTYRAWGSGLGSAAAGSRRSRRRWRAVGSALCSTWRWTGTNWQRTTAPYWERPLQGRTDLLTLHMCVKPRAKETVAWATVALPSVEAPLKVLQLDTWRQAKITTTRAAACSGASFSRQYSSCCSVRLSVVSYPGLLPPPPPRPHFVFSFVPPLFSSV